MVMNCWALLGIEPSRDQVSIRAAYRSRLPEHHPENDPSGFQALRAAYEAALKWAQSEQADNESPKACAQVLAQFHAMLGDAAGRFNSPAWRSFVEQLDRLSLDVLEEVNWALLSEVIQAGILAHECVRMLADRLRWHDRLLEVDVESARHIDEFLTHIAQPDPFNTALMGKWSVPAQIEALWYARNADHLFQQRPLSEYVYFAGIHTCSPLPSDPQWTNRLIAQMTQAGIGGRGIREILMQQHSESPCDGDILYLLTCQNALLGLEEQALQGWTRMWREHRDPKAAAWLLELCAKHQPGKLPLLIQAFDCHESCLSWPDDLADVRQAWASPGMRPETAARLFNARQLPLEGLARAYIEWLIGADELPLILLLIAEPEGPDLARLYRHSWALHRGAEDLLQDVLNEPPAHDVLDALIIEGFQRQAQHILHWLSAAPIPQALSARAGGCVQLLPELLTQEGGRALCDVWMRRLRTYDEFGLSALSQAFCFPDRSDSVDIPVLLGMLARHSVALPATPGGMPCWKWHRQTLFMMGLLAQPERWLALARQSQWGDLGIDHRHPLSRLAPCLTQALHDGAGVTHVLTELEESDPVHALIIRQCSAPTFVFDSVRLPSVGRLYQCYINGRLAFGDDPLSGLLLCAVLYHDPSLAGEQRRSMLKAISEFSAEEGNDWFEPFCNGLIRGEPSCPPRWVTDSCGVDRRVFSCALKVLARLVGKGGPEGAHLLTLQRAKDDALNSPELRLALTALLSWSERRWAVESEGRGASSWAFWRMGTRLGRRAFWCQSGGSAIVGLCGVVTLSVTPAISFGVLTVALVVLITAALRRLHDMGHGVTSLFLGGGLTFLLPFLPLVLFVWPGQRLPNRYGPPAGQSRNKALGLQAVLRDQIGQRT